MQATEALRKNRTIQFNIVLDAKALMNAMAGTQQEEDDGEEKEEGEAVRLLRKSRDKEETPIVKTSQIPMAG